jgi:hypothetical protein
VDSPGSNIDMNVQFHSFADLLRYLPRAAVIGFFAPFPEMWFASGSQVGTAGRLLSGFETILTYMIECLALVGLWRRWNQPGAWLLFLTSAIGVTALGLIVVNIGSLYRVRYPFWMMFVVLGAGGAVSLASRRFAGAAVEVEETAGAEVENGVALV